MHLFSKLFIGLAALAMMGCAAQKNENYVPSIAALEVNQTLVMKLKACHWGCTKGTIKFKNDKALLGLRNIELTPEEIDSLDQYFSVGPEVAAYQRCSLPIEISFKLKNKFQVLNTKDMQIYPCSFFDDDKISPLSLVEHFKETPREIPFWRLSPEEQSKQRVLIVED